MAILFFAKLHNPIGQQSHSWLKVFVVLIHEIFRNLTKVAWNLKISTFWSYCHFYRKLCFFPLQNFVYFLKKPSWQTICSLLNVFEIRSHQGFPKLPQDCIKFHNWSFFEFLSIWVRVWCIFSTQIAFISSRKPPGQGIFSLFNVFDFLSHQVSRKTDKKCIKFSNFWIFEFFCHFGSEFEAFFHFFEKASWITIFFSLDCFQHSKPGNLSIIWQKLNKIGKLCSFYYFWGHFWVILGSLGSTK